LAACALEIQSLLAALELMSCASSLRSEADYRDLRGPQQRNVRAATMNNTGNSRTLVRLPPGRLGSRVAEHSQPFVTPK
jgi:hypothetical protein